jgi:hypothetical protein
MNINTHKIPVIGFDDTLAVNVPVARRRRQARHPKRVGPLSLTGKILAYESGELSQEATRRLFQHLVDSGLAWKLQGHYGRTATALIEGGLVHV